MKKIVFISGIISAFLLLFVLTGWVDADEKVQKSLSQGNDMYESGEYTEALRHYEAGLEGDTENKILNFNAAQVAYMLGSYEKAVSYYENSEDCTDKYLNFGNIYYMAGESESVTEANEKVQFYAQALQIYKDGIMKYPQDVSLKYNYELVKEKIEELLEEEESEQESDGESGDQSEDEQSESEGEQSDSQNQSDDEQNEGDQSDSQSESDDEQNESEQSDSQSESEQDGDEDQQEEYSQGEEDESNTDLEAVERILAMLESQEEESLKNNQEVAGGKDDTNGW